MLRFDVHRVTKIRPEVRRFHNFTMLYLHLEGPDMGRNTVIGLFCYDFARDGTGQVDVPNGPMDLLNALGRP